MPKMFKTVKYMQKVVAEIVLKRNMDLFNSAQALIINIYVFISFFFIPVEVRKYGVNI